MVERQLDHRKATQKICTPKGNAVKDFTPEFTRFCPEGAGQDSPGQRPGNRDRINSLGILKGCG
ncbi:MAG TPA: hypothetical protein VHR66_14840, partial [Gemmataceae bacterium]|nr:hypothetical protein [Gemmataceae bacterium]